MNAHRLPAHADIVFSEVNLHLVSGWRFKAFRLRQPALQELQAKRRAELLQSAQTRRLPLVVNQFPDIFQIRLHGTPRPAETPLVRNISLKTPYSVTGISCHPGHCLNSLPSSNRAIIWLTLYLSSISEPPAHRMVPCCAHGHDYPSYPAPHTGGRVRSFKGVIIHSPYKLDRASPQKSAKIFGCYPQTLGSVQIHVSLTRGIVQNGPRGITRCHPKGNLHTNLDFTIIFR